MCPWVGSHAPSFGRQLWGLPSRMEYLSPQVVLLPRVYGTTASALWLELRDLSAWQATPTWTVYRLACHRLLPWPRVTFAMVTDAAWRGADQQPWGTAPAAGPVDRLGRPSAPDPWGVVCGFTSLGRPTCAVSWASSLLFSGVPARCVVLRVQCPGPLGSCSPVCPLGALCCVCGFLGHLAPVHRCARSVCCVACAVSWPLGSCSPVRTLRVLCCVCGVLGHLVAWLLITNVRARSVVLCVWCPGPLCSCSSVRPLGALRCVCSVLGHLAPVHRCACSVHCVACAVSWATLLLFIDVLARCVVLRVRCPGPLGSGSPVCSPGALRCVCGFLGHLAPLHRRACLAYYFACPVFLATWLLFTPVYARDVPLCAVSWASWLLFFGVLARRVVLCARCPGPLGSFSPVCTLGALCCV